MEKKILHFNSDNVGGHRLPVGLVRTARRITRLTRIPTNPSEDTYEDYVKQFDQKGK